MTREDIMTKAMEFMAQGYKPDPTNSIVNVIAQMMADFLIANTTNPNELTDIIITEPSITIPEIVVILKDFEEDTLMRGRKAVPPKNYEHVANYIIKKIKNNMKGVTK